MCLEVLGGPHAVDQVKKKPGFSWSCEAEAHLWCKITVAMRNLVETPCEVISRKV